MNADTNILCTVRISEADYRITNEGMVQKSTDGDNWVDKSPVIGSVGHAIVTIQERSQCYCRLWRYSRSDVTTAWQWMNDTGDLEVAPSPIIHQIAQDIAQCAWEHTVLNREVANATTH
jgi:hypothetical protein